MCCFEGDALREPEGQHKQLLVSRYPAKRWCFATIIGNRLQKQTGNINRALQQTTDWLGPVSELSKIDDIDFPKAESNQSRLITGNNEFFISDDNSSHYRDRHVECPHLLL